MHKQHQSRQVYLLVEDTFTPLLPGFLLKPRYTIRVPRYRYQASLKLLTTSCLTASSCSCRTSYKTLRIKRFSSSTKCTSSCLLLKLLQDCPTLSPLQVASATLGRANLKAKLAQHVTSSGYTRCSSSKPSVTGLSDCFQVDIKRTALCDTLRKLKPSASSKPSALHSGFTTTCTTTCCNRGR